MQENWSSLPNLKDWQLILIGVIWSLFCGTVGVCILFTGIVLMGLLC